MASDRLECETGSFELYLVLWKRAGRTQFKTAGFQSELGQTQPAARSGNAGLEGTTNLNVHTD